MIVFQSEDLQLNLTDRGLTYIEESNLFINDTISNYTFAFSFKAFEEEAASLGFINIDGVLDYLTKTSGVLTIDGNYFFGQLVITNIKGRGLTGTIYYGNENKELAETKLSDLPWPRIDVGVGFPDHFASVTTKEWPETPHNFVTAYKPEIKDIDNYEDFKGFVNNKAGGVLLDNFLNTTVTPNVPVNNNVVTPMPYIMEIFRMAYLSIGYIMRGGFTESELYKKMLYVPDNFIENYSLTEFQDFSLLTPNRFITLLNGWVINIYEKVIPLNNQGEYGLKMDMILNADIASYFEFQIFLSKVGTSSQSVLYTGQSRNDVVNLHEELVFTIDDANDFDLITIQMQLRNPAQDLTDTNQFVFRFNEGQVNVFPQTFSLSDHMPNVTFGQFETDFKNWFNLDITIRENVVYLDFLDDSLKSFPIDDHEHLKQVKPERQLNSNRVYDLKYLDGQQIYINKLGRTLATPTSADNVQDIEMQVYPLPIKENRSKITTEIIEDSTDYRLILYNGTINGEPFAVDTINGQKINLQEVYDRHWKNWLRFRTNSETYKDSFTAHISQLFSFKRFLLKYNKLHLLQKVTRKRVSEQYWDIETETETLQ